MNILTQIMRLDTAEFTRELEAANMKQVNSVFDKLSDAMEAIVKACDKMITELGYDPMPLQEDVFFSDVPLCDKCMSENAPEARFFKTYE